jgi:hypothetical protein
MPEVFARTGLKLQHHAVPCAEGAELTRRIRGWIERSEARTTRARRSMRTLQIAKHRRILSSRAGVCLGRSRAYGVASHLDGRDVYRLRTVLRTTKIVGRERVTVF